MHYQSVKQTPGQTRAVTDKHFTLLKSSNQPMTAARRRQGQQLYAGHGPPRRPWPLPLASGSCGTKATQPNPDVLPPEAWSCATQSTMMKRKVQSARAFSGRIQMEGGTSSFGFPCSTRVGPSRPYAWRHTQPSSLHWDQDLAWSPTSVRQIARPSNPKETRPNSQRETRSS